MKPFVGLLYLLLAASFVHAQTGTFTVYTTDFNGLTRTYGVYVPLNLTPNPDAIFFLHGTCPCLPTAPPLTSYHGLGLDRMADQEGFLLVVPISTWAGGGSKTGRFFWNSYGAAPYFPVPPADSAYLRWLVQTIQIQYNTSASYPVGMSSGGMMVERFCNESADLVTACAVMSGSLYLGDSPPSLPKPRRRVSIRFERGSADTTIGYCGGLFSGWGPPGKIAVPSVDVDLNYWLSVNGIAPNPIPLCTNGSPTPGRYWINLKSLNHQVNVEFSERIEGVHDLPPWELAEAVGWLLEH